MAAETVEATHKQYEIAFTSTSANELVMFQRQTGVKDIIAQPLLDSIIKRRQELQRKHLKMDQITAILRSEFQARGPILIMNPLLLIPGKHSNSAIY
jgi:hypothetical protein